MGKGAVGITITEGGIDQVLNALSGANVGVVKKAVKQKALEIVRAAREELRSKVPVKSGGTRRSQKAKSTRGGGAVLYSDRSGGASGKGQAINVIDKGSKKRVTKRGKNRGEMPAAHILEPIRTKARARVIAELNPFVIEAVRKNIQDALK